jgi:hypothetical protein
MTFEKKYLLGLLLCFSSLAQAGGSNFSDCLSILNSKTVVFKGKVKQLTDDGQSFAVVDAWVKGVMTVYTPKGAFDISTQGGTPTCERDSGFPKMEPMDTAHAISQMLVDSLTMGNDPMNSANNKAEVAKVCLKNKELAKLWNQPPAQSGINFNGADSSGNLRF